MSEHNSTSADRRITGTSVPSPEDLSAAADNLEFLIDCANGKGRCEEFVPRDLPWLNAALSLVHSSLEQAASPSPSSWETEVTAILEHLGSWAVRVREGGGPEDLKASLAVTLSGMHDRLNEQKRLADALLPIPSGYRVYRDETTVGYAFARGHGFPYEGYRSEAEAIKAADRHSKGLPPGGPDLFGVPGEQVPK